MKVLVVYAHYNPDSFTHALLDQVTRGLEDGGHEVRVNDLQASGFDPVFKLDDSVQFIHSTVPEDLLSEADLHEVVLGAAGDPVRRWLAKRWLRGKDRAALIEEIGKRKPKDVSEQQALVAEADGLVFVAPVFWMALPAIIKGWMERVFTYGFAYTLTPGGWRGDLSGRVPLLTQEKGLIVTPTFFTEEEYDKGWRDAMDTVICDWGLEMAGVKKTQHVYFYAVLAADEAKRRAYLDEAYRLARDF